MADTKMEKKEILWGVRATVKKWPKTEMAATRTDKVYSFSLGIFFWEQQLNKWTKTEMATTKMAETEFFEARTMLLRATVKQMNENWNDYY